MLLTVCTAWYRLIFMIDPIPSFEIMVLRMVRDEAPDLTMRQMAVMLICACETDHKKRYIKTLALELKVCRPAITRVADALLKHGYAVRRRDEADTRNVFLQLTEAGNLYVKKLGGMLEDAQGMTAC